MRVKRWIRLAGLCWPDFLGAPDPSPSLSGYAHVYEHVYTNNQKVGSDLGPNTLTLSWFS